MMICLQSFTQSALNFLNKGCFSNCGLSPSTFRQFLRTYSAAEIFQSPNLARFFLLLFFVNLFAGYTMRLELGILQTQVNLHFAVRRYQSVNNCKHYACCWSLSPLYKVQNILTRESLLLYSLKYVRYVVVVLLDVTFPLLLMLRWSIKSRIDFG